MIEIVRPGLLTTIQDLGRTGRGAIGVPPSGAMDEISLRIANRLVGNADDLAALEITLAGPEIRFDADAVAALVGSAFAADVDGRAVPHGEAVAIRRHQKLTIGQTLEGARAVLAIAGGIDVPAVLGSRSTFLRGGFGGLDGRALRAGDRLAIGRDAAPFRERRLRARELLRYDRVASLRVVLGPQAEAFTDNGVRALLLAGYRVSPRSDRMGLRLDGPAIERKAVADLSPEGIAPGAIQVPADGRPILLGADRPTTGGYTKIATVVTADLWRVGQAKPGDEIRFVAVDVEAARELYRQQQELLRSAVELA